MEYNTEVFMAISMLNNIYLMCEGTMYYQCDWFSYKRGEIARFLWLCIHSIFSYIAIYV